MGLLWGIEAFLRSPAKVAPVNLIPVQTLVLREESPPPEPKPAISQQIPAREVVETKSEMPRRKETPLGVDDLAGPLPKKGNFQPRLSIDQVTTPDVFPVGPEPDRTALEAKSQISAGTEARPDVSDLAGPIPKKGSFEPSLNVDHSPTLGVLPKGRAGEEVASKPMVSTFQRPPLTLSPVEPSRPDESPPVEIEIPRVLTEVETGGVETYSQTLKKVEGPVGKSRPSVYSLSELSPIPTIESPSIPEQREMTLAVSGAPPSEQVTRIKTAMRLQSPSQPRLRLAPKKESADDPTLIAPKEEPAIPDIKGTPSFPFPSPAEGAAFLFVLDTSGSVKGAPLEGIKRSAWEFVALMREKDRAGIMTFNDTTQMVISFTSEKKVLRREINKIRTAGTRTVLFDALTQAISEIKKEDRERKFVILFSDGKDEGSRSTPDEVINTARASQISVFCLGYSRIEKTYLRTLESISQRTGGVFAEAPLFQDIIELFRAARELTAEKES